MSLLPTGPTAAFDTSVGPAVAEVRFATPYHAPTRPELQVKVPVTLNGRPFDGTVSHALTWHGALTGDPHTRLKGYRVTESVRRQFDAWVATGEYQRGLTDELFLAAIRREHASSSSHLAQRVATVEAELREIAEALRARRVLVAAWGLEDPQERATALRLADAWTGDADELLTAVAGIHA